MIAHILILIINIMTHTLLLISHAPHSLVVWLSVLSGGGDDGGGGDVGGGNDGGCVVVSLRGSPETKQNYSLKKININIYLFMVWIQKDKKKSSAA